MDLLNWELGYLHHSLIIQNLHPILLENSSTYQHNNKLAFQIISRTFLDHICEQSLVNIISLA